MDMVSIKKFLRPEQPKPEHYIRFLQLLLNAISVHAAEANEIELTRFRQEVSNITETLSVRSTAEQIEVALGFVIRAVTGYNRMAARITQAHVNELQAMLAMMSKTIAFLSASSKTGIDQLQVVEKNLQTASTIGDIRVLRSKLNECLVLVRSESTRLRDESQTRIVELQAGVERTANHVRGSGIALPEAAPAVPRKRYHAGPSEDPLTGLPGREAAEELIAANISRGKEVCVTLFVVDRFAHINGRFESKTGDEVLLLVAHYLSEQLETGSLFRWSGPALASITAADQSLYEIEQQMTRIVSKRFEKTIESDRRMVLLPITCSCMVQKVSDLDSPEDVAETLDDFVATKAG
jgi:GGDEF domain-containing protein